VSTIVPVPRPGPREDPTATGERPLALWSFAAAAGRVAFVATGAAARAAVRAGPERAAAGVVEELDVKATNATTAAPKALTVATANLLLTERSLSTCTVSPCRIGHLSPPEP
jgi:hypothetical protein